MLLQVSISTYFLLQGTVYCICNDKRKEKYLNVSNTLKHLAGFRKLAEFEAVIQYFKSLSFFFFVWKQTPI